MTKIDLEQIIPSIIEKANFQHYLLSEGYSVIENVSNSNQKRFYKDSLNFKEIISLVNVNGTVKFFSSTLGDEGDIIVFVKNRIEIDGTYNEFTLKKNNIIEACKKLLKYLNQLEKKPKKEKLEPIDIVSYKELQKTTFTGFYEAKSIYNTTFLESKGIQKKTISSELFRDKIFNTEGLFYGDKSYDIINTAFALYDLNNKEKGLVNYNSITSKKDWLIKDNQDIIEAVSGSDLKSSFWISNDIDRAHKTTKNKLTLVDSPIEALAHYQIYKEDRIYFSFFHKSEKSYDIINNLVQEKEANIYLASNLTLENLVFELRLILAILNKEHPIEFLAETGTTVDFVITPNEHLKIFTERIQRLNNKLINEVISTLGKTSSRLLDDEIIKASMNKDKKILIKIPKSLQVLYQISKIMLDTFKTNVGIVTEKSKVFSWNTLSVKTKNEPLEGIIEAAEIFGFKNISY